MSFVRWSALGVMVFFSPQLFALEPVEKKGDQSQVESFDEKSEDGGAGSLESDESLEVGEEKKAKAKKVATENPGDSEKGTEQNENLVFGGGDDRDAAFFGSDDGEDDDFGAPIEEGGADDSLIQRLGDSLEELDERLELGGFLFLRLDGFVSDRGSAATQPLFSRNLFDIYMDGRPNDRLRGYVRGRLSFDPTVDSGATDFLGQPRENTSVLLDQLWLKFDIYRRVYITAGKQPIRWGSSRFWNPTDFLNSQIRDPLAVFDERTGVTLVKAHIPVESLGWNFYAVANLTGASTIEDLSGALRGEFLWGETEIALSAGYGQGKPLQFGFDISSALWLFDVRLEMAVQHGVQTPFYRGAYTVDFEKLVFESPTLHDRSDDWILQGTAGADISFLYNDEDSIILGVEYFYNDAGYKNADLYPWLVSQGLFEPLYMGRHYLSAYMVLSAPGDWNDSYFTLSGLGNLSDESLILRFDANFRVLTFMSLNAYSSVHLGSRGEFRFGVDGIDIPGLGTPAVDEALGELGVDANQAALAQAGIPTPLFEVGVGLRVTF